VTSFGELLPGVLARFGRLCVGIDPHAELLAAWGLPDSAAGVREFGLRVVDATAGHAGVVKPQVAFFERHGAAGYAALETVLAEARAADLVIIADVKRGDIGSSVDAAGEAWLQPGSPLEADAMTAVAYQGFGSLDPVLDRARRHGKGVFVLAATSNPEAMATQRAVRADGLTVAAGVVRDAASRNGAAVPGALGSVGVVIGATVSLADSGIDPTVLARTPILAPGFGHQGARIVDGPTIFGDLTQNVLVSVSRSILQAGPNGVSGAITAAAREAAAWAS
jgi:orotidine-5'-phosphate decarboxylase